MKSWSSFVHGVVSAGFGALSLVSGPEAAIALLDKMIPGVPPVLLNASPLAHQMALNMMLAYGVLQIYDGLYSDVAPFSVMLSEGALSASAVIMGLKYNESWFFALAIAPALHSLWGAYEHFSASGKAVGGKKKK